MCIWDLSSSPEIYTYLKLKITNLCSKTLEKYFKWIYTFVTEYNLTQFNFDCDEYSCIYHICIRLFSYHKAVIKMRIIILKYYIVHDMMICKNFID